MRMLALSPGPIGSRAFRLLWSAARPRWFVVSGVAIVVTLPPRAYAGIGPACREPAAIEDSCADPSVAPCRRGGRRPGLHQPASRGPPPVHRFTTCADPARR